MTAASTRGSREKGGAVASRHAVALAGAVANEFNGRARLRDRDERASRGDGRRPRVPVRPVGDRGATLGVSGTVSLSGFPLTRRDEKGVGVFESDPGEAGRISRLENRWRFEKRNADPVGCVQECTPHDSIPGHLPRARWRRGRRRVSQSGTGCGTWSHPTRKEYPEFAVWGGITRPEQPSGSGSAGWDLP